MEISRTQLISVAALAQIVLSPVAFADARQSYQEERAKCMSGPPEEDRTACLREAGAALQAEKRGELEDNPGVYETNRLARCAYLPKDDREDCERRMRGEGTTSGSVEGGGIYRELRTQVPAGK